MLSCQLLNGNDAAVAQYYEKHVREGDTLTAYYGAGNSYIGKQAPDGPVAPEVFRRILAGFDAETGDLLYNPSHYKEDPKTGLRAPKSTAVDLTFSAPKSMSTLWALADPRVRAQIEQAHIAAHADAMRFIEDNVILGRRGKGGAERIHTTGIVGVAAHHFTSRADDPQIHTHTVISEFVEGEDGKVTKLDEALLLRAAQVGGTLYQASLRHHLTDALGVRWTETEKGIAEIAGVSPKLMREFSQRTQQMEEELARKGIEHGSRAAQKAAVLATREKKSHADVVDLSGEWRDRAARLGVDPHELVSEVTGRTPVRARQHGAVLAELRDDAGLTAMSAHFTKRETLLEIANRVDASWSVEDILAATDRFYAHADVIGLTEDERLGEWLMRRSAQAGRATTRQMLKEERKVLNTAERLVAKRGPRCSTFKVSREIKAATLNAGQERVVRMCTREGGQLVVIEGVAGAGKSHTMKTVAKLLQDEGRSVIGCSTAGKATKDLTEDAKLDDGKTLAALRRAVARDDIVIDANTTIIHDEHGMTETRDLAWLLNLAEDTGAQLVMLGDPYQLQPVGAGGMAHELVTDVTLGETVRAKEEWERELQLELRAGEKRAAKAWAEYRKRGRIEVLDDRDEARHQVFSAWMDDHAAGNSSAMVTYRRTDVIGLNNAARGARIAAGELTPRAEVTVETPDGTWSMCRGDEVILTTSLGGGLENGQTAKLERVHATGAVTLRIKDGSTDRNGKTCDRLAKVDRKDVRSGAVALGYALTGHRTQGATYDTVHVLADHGADANWVYVAMSRGRSVNSMTFAGEPVDVELTEEDTAGLSDEQIEVLRARMETAQAWQEAVRQLTKSGNEDSAHRTIVGRRPVKAHQRAAEAIAGPGDDVDEIAWELADRERMRREADLLLRAKRRTPVGLDMAPSR